MRVARIAPIVWSDDACMICGSQSTIAAMTDSYTPSGGASPAPGRPLGRGRSAGLTVLVTIVTFGIWMFVWSFKNGEELKNYRGEGLGGALYIIITLFVSPVTMFLLADEVGKLYTEDGREAPINAMWGLWFLLPLIGNLIWYFKVQNCLNDFWESKGAGPSAGL